jgi:hypothetical protein
MPDVHYGDAQHFLDGETEITQWPDVAGGAGDHSHHSGQFGHRRNPRGMPEKIG